jgi:hypothetical protein
VTRIALAEDGVKIAPLNESDTAYTVPSLPKATHGLDTRV